MTRPEIENTQPNRLKGFWRLAEIQRVVSSRLRRREAVEWEAVGYTMATILLAFPAGRHMLPQTLQGTYWTTWPDCSAETMLCRGKRRPFTTMADVAPEVVADIVRGIERAARRRRRDFLLPDTVADLLGVTRAEREALDLRFIGAIDFKRAAREAARNEKKKAASKGAKARSRIGKGMRPQSESMAAQAREHGVKPDTFRARNRRVRNVALLVASNVAFLEDNKSIDNTYLTSKNATRKRDNATSLANLAREMGLKPDTLRARIRRAGNGAAPPQSGARRIVSSHKIPFSASLKHSCGGGKMQTDAPKFTAESFRAFLRKNRLCVPSGDFGDCLTTANRMLAAAESIYGSGAALRMLDEYEHEFVGTLIGQQRVLLADGRQFPAHRLEIVQ